MLNVPTIMKNTYAVLERIEHDVMQHVHALHVGEPDAGGAQQQGAAEQTDLVLRELQVVHCTHVRDLRGG